MKKNIIKILSVFLITVMVFTGCSNGTSPEVLELQTTLDKEVAKNKELEDQIQILTTEVETLKQENKELIDEIREADDIMLKLYTANVDTLAKEEIGKIAVTVDSEGNIQDLPEVLDILANELSKQVFEGLTIDIEDIKIVDGKKVAVINLKEDSNLSVGWEANFLQGSTGAAITNITLKETFLQKEYTGEWLDGIQIFYEGQSPEFDHMPNLGEIIYR